MTIRSASLLLALGSLSGVAWGQTAQPAPVVRVAHGPETSEVDATQPDHDLDAAQDWVGRAAFLRGFYSADELKYDAAGRVQGAPKSSDWTLSGFDIQKVERKGVRQVELDGVRVVIRWNDNQRVFERRPQKDEAVRVVIDDSGSGVLEPRLMRSALEAAFSQGIDPGLQRATPDYWRHYFDPGMPWPKDQFDGQTIYQLGGPAAPKDVMPPVPEKEIKARFTEYALREKVQGTVTLRVVVGTDGVAGRIAVVKPLGYGLEERAVEAVRRWRFAPATRGGEAVAAAVLVNMGFEVER